MSFIDQPPVGEQSGTGVGKAIGAQTKAVNAKGGEVILLLSRGQFNREKALVSRGRRAYE